MIAYSLELQVQLYVLIGIGIGHGNELGIACTFPYPVPAFKVKDHNIHYQSRERDKILHYIISYIVSTCVKNQITSSLVLTCPVVLHHIVRAIH